MKLNIFGKEMKNKKEKQGKKDLVNFVSDQFKQLVKRNLRVPIQLYHL